MIDAALRTVHVMAVVVWIGGMAFAQFALRPAVAALDPPARLRLMHDVLGRFFRAVLVASSLVLLSGAWMIGRAARRAVQSGGRFEMPPAWTVMAVLGVAMVAIFLHVRFALYRRLHGAVAATDWPAAAAALAQVRTWVSVNLGLGLVVLVAVLMR